MDHRAISDIFPASYPNPLDAEDVQRKCASYLSSVNRWEDIYYWLSHELCPYRREALTEGMWELLKQKSADPDDDTLRNVPTYMWEEIESHFKHIIRCARAEQLADNMQVSEDMAKTNPEVAAVVIPQIQTIEQQLKKLSDQVESLAEEIRKNQPSIWVHWPYYTSKATEDEKRFFETQLLLRIQSRKRSMTKDIKNYLNYKEQAGIIYRPEQLNAEYEALCAMGYTRSLKAYYNT